MKKPFENKKDKTLFVLNHLYIVFFTWAGFMAMTKSAGFLIGIIDGMCILIAIADYSRIFKYLRGRKLRKRVNFTCTFDRYRNCTHLNDSIDCKDCEFFND